MKLQLLVGVAALIGFACGCGKQSETAPAAGPIATNQVASAPGQGAPGPMATPAAAQVIAPADNIDATLAELTRELRRTMIGRKLSGSFEEFVAIRNLTVPPPPAGKKYAISKQWRVVLVDR